MKKTVSLALLFILGCPCGVPAQQPQASLPPPVLGVPELMRMAAIRPLEALGLEFVAQPVPVYFRPGGRARALALAETIADAEAFFGDSLGVRTHPTLAVLPDADWEEVSRKPLGSPYMQVEAQLIYMPERFDSFLVDHYLAEAERCIASGGATGDPEALRGAARRIVDLILFHEIGHAYAAAMGTAIRPLWFAELLAGYIGYGYLYRKRPEDARAWLDLMACRATGSRWAAATIRNFWEAPGNLDFLWYQAEFARYVGAIYPSTGLEFVRRAAAGYSDFGAYPSNEQVIDYMDGLVPGFKKWADGVGHNPTE